MRIKTEQIHRKEKMKSLKFALVIFTLAIIGCKEKSKQDSAIFNATIEDVRVSREDNITVSGVGNIISACQVVAVIDNSLQRLRILTTQHNGASSAATFKKGDKITLTKRWDGQIIWTGVGSVNIEIIQ
jgi:hypothetical protein